MRCINCGAPLNDENSIFCEKCYKEEVAKNAGQVQNEKSDKKEDKPKKSKKKIVRNVIISVVSVLLAIVLIAVMWLLSLLDKPNKDTLSGDLGIESEQQGADLPFTEDVKNIALYGLDTRQDNNSGRSDAIIVLSIDRINKEIKLTSIARDTYITFESGKHDKLTHAWAYGKADLAVKTLNSNFNLDVTDYVSVNFFQFAEIIDYIGGVVIDVDEAEMKVMNKTYMPYIIDSGIKTEYITEPGVQRLDGGQALAYARNRYTGSDLTRGNRQREVLEAMFNQVKEMNPLKYPKLVEMVLSECTTTLSSSEMLSIGSWALFNSPTIHSLGIPNAECGAKGQMINGKSYMVYDLELASSIMHDFIYTSAKEPVSSEVSTSSEK